MIITNIALILLFSLSVSCSHASKVPISMEDPTFNDYFFSKKNIPKVLGKILNMSKEDLKNITINYTILSHFSRPSKFTKVNADGTFELKLDYAFPFQQIWITIDSLYKAYIYADSDLFIELDGKVLKYNNGGSYIGPGIKYAGSDGKLNTYLNNHTVYMQNYQVKIRHAIADMRDKDMPMDEFVQKYDTLHKVLRGISKKYMKENPSKYFWIIIDDSYSEYYATLCDKYAKNLVITGKGMNKELWDKMNIHKPKVISSNSAAFYNCIFSYICLWTVSNKMNYTSINYKLTDLIKTFDTTFYQEKADFLKMKFITEDTKDAKLIFETIYPSIKTEWCKSIMQSDRNKTIENLQTVNNFLNTIKSYTATDYIGRLVSQIPSGAKLYVTDSLKAEALLTNLRKVFKEKALYINFWSTGCSGSIQEMPYSKKLYNEVKDLPIEFIYLSNAGDASQDKWMAIVSKYELPGVHLYVNTIIFNELMSLFSFSAYPSYAFIDANGIYKQGIIRPSLTNRNKFIELINEELPATNTL